MDDKSSTQAAAQALNTHTHICAHVATPSWSALFTHGVIGSPWVLNIILNRSKAEEVDQVLVKIDLKHTSELVKVRGTEAQKYITTLRCTETHPLLFYKVVFLHYIHADLLRIWKSQNTNVNKYEFRALLVTYPLNSVSFAPFNLRVHLSISATYQRQDMWPKPSWVPSWTQLIIIDSLTLDVCFFFLFLFYPFLSKL